MKKYIVEDHSDGKRYEVIADELGYLHNKQPEQKPEVKPVSFKDIERLYKKEFPEPQSQQKAVNEIKRLHKMLNDK